MASAAALVAEVLSPSIRRDRLAHVYQPGYVDYLTTVLGPSRTTMELELARTGRALQSLSSCQLKERRRLARRPGVATPLGRVYPRSLAADCGGVIDLRPLR